MTTGRRWIGTAGTQTAGIGFGGQIPPSGYSTNVTEAYDGTSWTNGGSLNVTRAVNAVGGGINQDASSINTLAAGGYQSSGSPKTFFNESESYDGTSWTAQPNMSTSIGYGTGGGTGSAGISAGSYTGSLPAVGTTEEFNKSTSVTTAGAWASGGALNTARGTIAGAGIQTAALAISGEPPAPGGLTESYDGTSWTEVNALNTGRSQVGAAGTSTAAVAFGGEPPMTTTETWDGTNWTASPGALNTETRNCAGWGSQTAAVKAGGFGPGVDYSATVETWNGSSWTSAPNSLPATNANNRGFGTSTAGVNCGGLMPSLPTAPPNTTAITSEWDGSAWASGGLMITARSVMGTCGTQTAGLIAGGYTTVNSAVAEGYDGTSWSTRPSLATARQAPGGLGTNSVSTAGLVCGGNVPPSSAATTSVEVFTGETSAVNYKTITTS